MLFWLVSFLFLSFSRKVKRLTSLYNIVYLAMSTLWRNSTSNQTSVCRCHGSWQNSPHKDEFVFISITNIHQFLVTDKFNVQKSTHLSNIRHEYCDLHFFKRYYFRGLPNRMFCFEKMIVTQAQLNKKCLPENATNIHHIPFHGVKRKKYQNTQTHKDIHITQNWTTKAAACCYFVPEGIEGGWLPNYWCTAS